jgi:hypothetical protein
VHVSPGGRFNVERIALAYAGLLHIVGTLMSAIRYENGDEAIHSRSGTEPTIL